MFEDFKIDEELIYKPSMEREGYTVNFKDKDQYKKWCADVDAKQDIQEYEKELYIKPKFKNEQDIIILSTDHYHQMKEDIKFLLSLLFEKANTQEEWDKCKEIESRYNIEV